MCVDKDEMVSETHQDGLQKGHQNGSQNRQQNVFDASCVNRLLDLVDDLKRAIGDKHEAHVKVTVLEISNVLNKTENVPVEICRCYQSLARFSNGLIWDVIWKCADEFEKSLEKFKASTIQVDSNFSS